MEIMNLVIEYFNHTWGYVELLGTIASAICVYLAVKQNIWTWFWGAIGVGLFGPLFYHYQLYSDAGLQILFFLPMQVLGFMWWSNSLPVPVKNFMAKLPKWLGKVGDDLPVIRLSTSTNIALVIGMLTITSVNGYYMANYTDASFPYVDALTTWMSVFAQVLMIKKVWESWVLWVAMDLIAIQVYMAKDLVVVSGLYELFLVLATMGGMAWYQSMKEQDNVKQTV